MAFCVLSAHVERFRVSRMQEFLPPTSYFLLSTVYCLLCTIFCHISSVYYFLSFDFCLMSSGLVSSYPVRKISQQVREPFKAMGLLQLSWVCVFNSFGGLELNSVRRVGFSRNIFQHKMLQSTGIPNLNMGQCSVAKPIAHNSQP